MYYINILKKKQIDELINTATTSTTYKGITFNRYNSFLYPI